MQTTIARHIACNLSQRKEVLNITYLEDRGFIYEYSGNSVWKTLKWKYFVLRRFLAFERYQRRTRSQEALLKIQKLEGVFSGPAIIVGNGPSSLGLKSLNLTKLRETHTIFAMNYFLLSEVAKELPPHYLFICDENFWNESNSNYRKMVKNTQSQFDFFVVQPDYLEDYTNEENTLKIRKNPLISFTRKISVTGFTCGLPNYTVFYMVAAALHLGYSPVYLVGHDFNHYKFIEWHEDGFKLSPHHSYAENIRSWSGRESVSRILSANLQQIDALKLFTKYPVFCLGEKPPHDILPFVRFDEIHEKR